MTSFIFPVAEYSEESINKSVSEMGGLYPADCEGDDPRTDKEKQVSFRVCRGHFHINIKI